MICISDRKQDECARELGERDWEAIYNIPVLCIMKKEILFSSMAPT